MYSFFIDILFLDFVLPFIFFYLVNDQQMFFFFLAWYSKCWSFNNVSLPGMIYPRKDENAILLDTPKSVEHEILCDLKAWYHNKGWTSNQVFFPGSIFPNSVEHPLLALTADTKEASHIDGSISHSYRNNLFWWNLLKDIFGFQPKNSICFFCFVIY